MKICRKCNQLKNSSAFQYHHSNKDRLNSICKNCNNSDKRKFRKENPEHTKLKNLQIRYGITLEDYYNMLIYQNEVCAICNKPEIALDTKINKVRDLAVDHCHKTGKVRALLCGTCNNAIGSFKDEIQLLKKAIKYLEYHNGN